MRPHFSCWFTQPTKTHKSRTGTRLPETNGLRINHAWNLS